METHRIHAIELSSGFHFLFRQPFLVGKREFELITIESRVFGPFDRKNFFHLDLADACQVVDYLLMLVTNLFLIGEMLPFATAAHAEMFTERHGTQGRIFMKVYGFSLRITMFLTCQLYVDDISGGDKRYEYHHVIHSCDSLSFCGYVCYCYLFQ